jgi:hypothetical protein
MKTGVSLEQRTIRTLTDTFRDSATRPTLYRIWVPLHDGGEVPLVSIWIDPALTAFQSRVQVTTNAISLEGQARDSTHQFLGDDLSSILPRRN